MCPSLAPPQLFLPSPGQDPMGWFVLLFTLMCGGVIIWAVPILLGGLARYLGLAVLVLGFVLIIGGLIIGMIFNATYFAVYNWETAAPRSMPSVCASQATYNADSRQAQIAPLGRIGDGVVNAGLYTLEAFAIVYFGHLSLSPRARDAVRERASIARHARGAPSNSE